MKSTGPLQKQSQFPAAYILLGIVLAAVGLFGLYSLVCQFVPQDEQEVVVDAGFAPIDIAVAGDQKLAPSLPVHSKMKVTSTAMTMPDAQALTEVMNLYATSNALGQTTEIAPSPTPRLLGKPDRIIIPDINLDVPIVPAHHRVVKLAGQQYDQWLAPDQKAAGWPETSAELGQPSNLVLLGHHNIAGQVFKDLVKLTEGDLVTVMSGQNTRTYRIGLIMKLEERGATPEQRADNARWLLPSDDERLTMITCWPYESNTHRLILIASPVD